MEILFLIIGILVGGILSWFWSNNKFKETNKKILQELSKEKELRIKAEVNLESLKEVYNKAQENLKNSFNNIASEAIKNNNESFLFLANQTMEKYINKAENNFEKQNIAFSSLLKPLKEKIDKHEDLVKNIQTNSSETFGSIKNYIEELNKNQNNLSKETHALVSALKSPKIRGKWGEIGLKRIIEFSGMSSYCDFSEQVNVQTDDKRLRPDLVVYLPDNKKIVIDSKVPLNSYLEALETEDEKIKQQHLINHTKAVKNHIKELSSKAYWSQFDESVDFVVLYIEVEPAFGAALAQNNKLVFEAIQKRIVFATPTTLISMLQTVAYSWKQQKATDNAVKIWHSAKEIYNRIAIFTEHLQKIGVNINNLTKTYNNAVGSWEHRVAPGLKTMNELGIDSEKKKIENLYKIENLTRELK